MKTCGKSSKLSAKKVLLEDRRGFLDEFKKESDRATAILGATFAEGWLTWLIASFLIDEEDKVDELLGQKTDSPGAPLGTFSAKIKAGYCLGLLTPLEEQDLTRIRKIRNYFAHDLQGLTFKSPKVREKCKFSYPILAPNRTLKPREAYMLAIWNITSRLRRRALGETKTLRRKVWPEFRGF